MGSGEEEQGGTYKVLQKDSEIRGYDGLTQLVVSLSRLRTPSPKAVIIILSVCSVSVAPPEGVTCVSSSISSSESALLDGGSKPGVHLGVLLQDVGRLADDLAEQRVDVVLEVGLDLGLLFN